MMQRILNKIYSHKLINSESIRNYAKIVQNVERNRTNNKNISAKYQNDNIKSNDMPHVPVMATEVMQYLSMKPGQIIVDMTFGAGGHSTKILESIPGVKIFALDRDPLAHQYAIKLSEKYPDQVVPLLGRFSELPKLLTEHDVELNSIDTFLFDLGCSSMQFDIPGRGFSISNNGPLDMRMDGFRCPEMPTAADVLERADEMDLAHIIKCYGGEKRAKKIARAIIDARYSFRTLKTTWELAQLIESTIGEIRKDQLGRFAHSATKTFQALRIFVNNELNEFNYGIVIAQSYLKINGRLITISFHSLEDTIIKRHITGEITDNVANTLPLKYSNYNKIYNEEELQNSNPKPWKMLHKHVIVPTDEEINFNPRARSAKFRAIVKVC